MIDWLTACAYLDERVSGRELPCDRTLRIQPDGTVLYERPEKLKLKGSHDDSLHLWRTGNKLWVSGNYVKYRQGHNLFGSDDCLSLTADMVKHAADRAEFKLTNQERSAVSDGLVGLTRVDCTAMADFGDQGLAESYLAHVGQHGHWWKRGRAHLEKGTVYFGYRSRHSVLKLYCKATELKERGGVPEGLAAARGQLGDYAEGALRMEVMLRRVPLNTRGLGHACKWQEEIPMRIVQEAMDALSVPENMKLGGLVVEALPGHLRRTYKLWCSGVNLGDVHVMSRATFYRHRRELLGYGVDIASTVREEEDLPVQVVPLREVVAARLLGVPDWAVGTDLYYQPAKVVAV